MYCSISDTMCTARGHSAPVMENSVSLAAFNAACITWVSYMQVRRHGLYGTDDV